MGRLGFNLVRQKEASKQNVESGVQAEADQQQNESNENVEIGELLIAIDKANRTIKNYRWLSMVLIAVIITLCGYIFITQARFHSQQSVVHALNKMHEAMRGDYDAQAERLERSQSLVLEENLQRALDEQKALRTKDNLEANEKYNILQESFTVLQAEHEDLQDRCEKNENSLKEKMQKLQEEREEMLTKIETSNRKLELQKSESQKLLTTTTPRPRFFGSTQLKKLNDLMKDIESGAAIHDIDGFMKKTDDVFRH